MDDPPLVLIHGLIGTLDYYGPAERITRAGVYSADLLGYGSRRHVAKDRLSLRSQAEYVAAIVASLRLGRVWLLAHSMGGAVAVMLADRYPQLVEAIINVEGNFTLKDAFWSRKIIAMTPEEWSESYRDQRHDIRATLENWGVAPTPHRVAWAQEILDNQPAETLYAMARAIVEETGAAGYAAAVQRVVSRGVPMHLVAGERSAEDWDVPDTVRAAARSYTIIPDAGHLMMLEKPREFCKTVDRILAGHSAG